MAKISSPNWIRKLPSFTLGVRTPNFAFGPVFEWSVIKFNFQSSYISNCKQGHSNSDYLFFLLAFERPIFFFNWRSKAKCILSFFWLCFYFVSYFILEPLESSSRNAHKTWTCIISRDLSNNASSIPFRVLDEHSYSR